MIPTLVVFVKLPRPGRVKSRLARDIGWIDALWWYRHQTRRLIGRLGDDPRWRLMLAVTPDAALHAPDWPAHLPRIAQGRGDLGQRMARALRISAGPVFLVGSDIPGLAPTHVARAFALLGRNDVVIGAATDGGFWGIGRAAGLALPPGALCGIDWSAASTRQQTERTLAPLRIGRAATLEDVDTGADLDRLRHGP